MDNSHTNRNFQLDFLRFVGISCIILAHQHVPRILFQLRNFDVPLMVMISGFSYANYSEKNYTTYINYVKDRFFRLVIPTWLFLAFYNFYVFYSTNNLPTISNVMKQICMVGGTDVGVWIIRIFFSMALIAPFIRRIDKKIQSNYLCFFCMITIFGLYELFYLLSSNYMPVMIFKTFKTAFFFTVGYGLILWFGMRISLYNPNVLRNCMLVFGIIFVSCFFYFYFIKHSIVTTQRYKYPPRLYYLSYALFASIVMFYLTQKYSMQRNKIIQFIGSATLWIYLWHWFVMKAYGYLGLPTQYVVKFSIVYLVAVLIVCFQVKLVIYFANKLEFSITQKKLLYKMLTG